jgi:DNA-binding response OmpR family regulator
MSGAELGERIVRDPQVARPHLLLLSSLEHKGGHARYLDLGFEGYLMKPIRGRELRDAIREIFGQERQGKPPGTQPLITRA